MIKLGELRAARSGTTGFNLATRTEHFHDMWHYVDINAHTDSFPETYAKATNRHYANAIAATHNAADVLIEIAEAALALDSADDDFQQIAFDVATGEGGTTAQVKAAAEARRVARVRYHAALAKVQP